MGRLHNAIGGEDFLFFSLDFTANLLSTPASALFEGMKAINSSLDNKKFSDNINYMCAKGYIKKQGRGVNSTLEITESGLERLNKIQMRRIAPAAYSSWDNKWRLISYDIPEEKRAARSAIRRLVKELGCIKLHDSVWIHPLDISKQIAFVQRIYGVTENITLFVVDTFDREAEFINRFNLRQ